MEPLVAYTTAPNQQRIALSSLGAGSPLVFVPSGPWTTIQMQWGVPAWRAWNEQIAQQRQLILFDPRGAGLSDQPAAGPGADLETQVEDLRAVTQHFGLERCALFAAQHAGPAALAFAARYPERVSHLVLWCTYARGADYFGEPRSQAVHHMLDRDWDLFTETIAHDQLGWSDPASASRLAELLREHLTPTLMAQFDAATRLVDVTPLLPQVQAPVLVLHRGQLRHPELAISRRLAASLPNARLLVLQGASIAPFVGDVRAALDALDAFLGPSVRVRVSPVLNATGESLSAREAEVLRLLAAGFSNAEIADQLIIAPGTVKTHTARIFRKLDVDNRTRAVARAREFGLLD
jgi:DNA-binding CsgD family transcriptional regulator/pimeloyl-ACP methyl ester carboxylesterase